MTVPSTQDFVVADMGATNLRVARVSRDFRIVRRLRTRTPDDAEGQLAALTDALEEVGARTCTAVGVGVAARVTWPEGAVVSGGLIALADVPLARMFTRELCVPVAVDNDGHLAALAEARLGVARDVRDAVTVTIGSGIGGGITHDGELRRGQSFAGEVGHMPLFPAAGRCGCGSGGCWELLASGRALRRALAGVSVDEALAPSHAGDSELHDRLRMWAGSLCDGVATLITVLDPGAVVLGGGVGRDAMRILDRHQNERLRYYRARTAVIPADFGDDAGLIGAALIAAEAAAVALAGR